MTKYIGIKPYTYWRYPFRTAWKWVVETPTCIKDFCQRGWRGYADRDVWSLGSYLVEFMPAAVDRLLQSSYGYPITMDEFIDGDENQFILWKNILSDIKDGFEAGYIAREQPWLKEAPIPEGNIFDNHNPFSKWYDENRERIIAMETELYEIEEHGLSLFAEFFDSLWD